MPVKKRLNNIVQMTFSKSERDSIKHLSKKLGLSSSILCRRIVLSFLEHSIFEVSFDPYHKPKLN